MKALRSVQRIARMLGCLTTIAVALFANGSVQAAANEITVLGVVLPGGDYAVARDYLRSVETDVASWLTYDVQIRLRNWGYPVAMPTPTGTYPSGGNSDSLWQTAVQYEQMSQLRGDADVILFFGPDMTANNGQTSCGHAPARQWTSYSGLPVNYRFIADASGYDLRGADDYYSAIINTQNSNCTIHDEIAIHEFGHLFGAGHEYSSLTANGYLYDDSYANPIFLIPGGGRTRYRSIVATVGSYKLYNHFSDQSLAAQTNNHRAVLKTASSVARYRASGTPVDPPPVTPPLPPPVVVPGCGLSPPVSLTGALYATCVPFPATTHTITWYDTCPGATVDYQIEYSQPDGAPYVVLGSTPNIWEYISVNGASSRLRVRACNGATCSSPSGTYLANDSC